MFSETSQTSSVSSGSTAADEPSCPAGWCWVSRWGYHLQELEAADTLHLDIQTFVLSPLPPHVQDHLLGFVCVQGEVVAVAPLGWLPFMGSLSSRLCAHQPMRQTMGGHALYLRTCTPSCHLIWMPESGHAACFWPDCSSQPSGLGMWWFVRWVLCCQCRYWCSQLSTLHTVYGESSCVAATLNTSQSVCAFHSGTFLLCFILCLYAGCRNTEMWSESPKWGRGAALYAPCMLV